MLDVPAAAPTMLAETELGLQNQASIKTQRPTSSPLMPESPCAQQALCDIQSRQVLHQTALAVRLRIMVYSPPEDPCGMCNRYNSSSGCEACSVLTQLSAAPPGLPPCSAACPQSLSAGGVSAGGDWIMLVQVSVTQHGWGPSVSRCPAGGFEGDGGQPSQPPGSHAGSCPAASLHGRLLRPPPHRRRRRPHAARASSTAWRGA